MGIPGAAGLGVGPGQALVAGTLGGQRLIVGSGLGAGGVGLRADVVPRGEDFVGLYGHRLASAGRDEEAAAAAATSRGGPSFVAYVGGEVRLHAVFRDEEAAAGGGGVSHSRSPVPVLTVAHGRGDEQGEVAEAEPWPPAVGILSRAKGGGRDQEEDAAGGSSRVVDVSTLEEANTGMDARLQVVATAGSGGVGERGGDQAHLLQLQTVDPMRQRSAIGSMACQDCGNQAKKDCLHMRCRTCCKSRGFLCSTHVRSTWVPAAKRRERQQAELAAIVTGQPRPKSKRARTLALAGATNAATSHTSTSTGTPPRSSDFTSSHLPQDPKFKGTLPPEVRAPAVFKCVRVTGVNDGHDEYAYQAIVKIGGHIFKGILYDQGLDKANVPSSVAELQLGARSTPSSSALIDLAGIYGASGGALLGDNEITPVHY